MQIEGIPPPSGVPGRFFLKWPPVLVLLLMLNGMGVFQSFYEVIRVKVACRDPAKIPFERLV